MEATNLRGACSATGTMSGRSRRKKLVRSKRLKESVSAALEPPEADEDLVDPQPLYPLRPFEDEQIVNSEVNQPSENRDWSQT